MDHGTGVAVDCLSSAQVHRIPAIPANPPQHLQGNISELSRPCERAASTTVGLEGSSKGRSLAQLRVV